MKGLTEFIDLRITILERFETSTSKRDFKQESSRSSHHSNHVSQAVTKVNCRLCSMDTHNTHKCQEFKSKSVDERYNPVINARPNHDVESVTRIIILCCIELSINLQV